MAHVTITSAQQFEDEVLKSDVPVLVDYWAEWCGPCRMVAPIFDELSENYAGKIKFAKVDTDALPEIPSRYGIQSIPTMIAYKGGEEMSRVIGAHPKNDYVTIIDGLL